MMGDNPKNSGENYKPLKVTKGGRNDQLGIMENPQSPNYYRQQERARRIREKRDTVKPSLENVPDKFINDENMAVDKETGEMGVERLLRLFPPPKVLDAFDDVYPIPNAPTKPKFESGELGEPVPQSPLMPVKLRLKNGNEVYKHTLDNYLQRVERSTGIKLPAKLLLDADPEDLKRIYESLNKIL